MKTLTLEAPAKINLTLDILGTRPDGYHDMRMVMQAVSLGSMLLIYLWAARMEMSAANYMGFIAAYGAAAGLGAVRR